MTFTFDICNRCLGLFPEGALTECVTTEGVFLANLCPQCLQGWLDFEKTLEEEE